MPVPSGPVTEISIRVMPSGAIDTMGMGNVGMLTCWPCPPPTAPYLAEMVPTDEKSAKLLQYIMDTTGEGQEDVIRKLGTRITERRLAEEIEKYAKELQQADEGEK